MRLWTVWLVLATLAHSVFRSLSSHVSGRRGVGDSTPCRSTGDFAT